MDVEKGVGLGVVGSDVRVGVSVGNTDGDSVGIDEGMGVSAGSGVGLSFVEFIALPLLLMFSSVKIVPQIASIIKAVEISIGPKLRLRSAM